MRGAYAHRLAFEVLVEPVAVDLDLDHLCRVRCCVNPAHLEQVTRKVNTQRGVAGATTRARMLGKTHCPAGHEYSGENMYVPPGGGKRDCKICRRARLKKPSTIERAKVRRLERERGRE